MRNRNLKIAIAVLTFSASSLVLAEGIYVGAGGVQNRADADATSSTASYSASASSSTSSNAFIGYKRDFGNNFLLGAEARFVSGYGKMDSYTGPAGGFSGITTEIKNSGGEYSLLPEVKVSDVLGLFARIGVSRVRLDASGGGSTVTGDDVNANVLGIGASYAISKTFAVRAEYQTLSLEFSNAAGGTTKARSSGFGIAGVLTF